MKARNLWLALFISVFIISGYAYAKEVKKEAPEQKEKIEKPARKVQGRDDALQIAKDYLKEEDIQSDYLLVGHMTKPLVKLIDGVWHVVFLKKEKGKKSLKTQSLRIKIDNETGYVLEKEEQEGFFLDKSFR